MKGMKECNVREKGPGGAGAACFSAEWLHSLTTRTLNGCFFGWGATGTGKKKTCFNKSAFNKQPNKWPHLVCLGCVPFRISSIYSHMLHYLRLTLLFFVFQKWFSGFSNRKRLIWLWSASDVSAMLSDQSCGRASWCSTRWFFPFCF